MDKPEPNSTSWWCATTHIVYTNRHSAPSALVLLQFIAKTAVTAHGPCHLSITAVSRPFDISIAVVSIISRQWPTAYAGYNPQRRARRCTDYRSALMRREARRPNAKLAAHSAATASKAEAGSGTAAGARCSAAAASGGAAIGPNVERNTSFPGLSGSPLISIVV